ncbi:ras-related protein Rab-44 [Echinops telfairi]|uniref:Ras-related protein Rab-44 n=1 Tax=Echinops telfairi TaxID=9371 RepID=A0AC55DG38_ECHTE|nr:ras-related protein Rab-44 [Echinops telfairi]
METGQRVSRKGRKLASSRRRQTQEPADDQDAPGAPKPESWSLQATAELQDFFQNCGAKERGFVTRDDVAVAKFSFLGSEEEPGMIFDWVDMQRKGRLSLEEFSSGLKSIFGSNLSTHRLRRRRTVPSKRGSAAASFPALDEAEAEEKAAFLAFLEQLGAGPLLPEQAEIWQLWAKLRQEEPHLAGNLEGFLAKMTSRLHEARADKEALELTLRKRDSDHHREVQELYNEMEQQIHQERQQLQAESDSRGLALSLKMHEVLEAKEREVQQLTQGHRELETQLDTLSSTQQEASAENQQLREAERDLAGRLAEVQGQLQETRGHLKAAKGRVSWQMEEEDRQVVTRPGEGQKTPDPQASAPDETPLPGLFGDNDDWDQLLSSFSSPPTAPQALQLSWSPPPTPRAPSAPQTPRVVRHISISEPRAWPFGQEPASDLDGAPRTSPGGPPRAEEGGSGGLDGKDSSSEQPMQPPGPEAKDESRPGLEAHFHWDFPGVPARESGGLVAATLKMLIPLEEGSPPQAEPPLPQAPAGPGELFQDLDPDDKGQDPEAAPARAPGQTEPLLQDPHTADSEQKPRLPGSGALMPGPSQELEPPAATEGLQPGLLVPAEQEGHPGGLRGAHGQVCRPDELPALPQQRLEEKPRAEQEQQDAQGGQDTGAEQSAEAEGLGAGPSEHPSQDAPQSPDPPQAQAEAEVPAHEKPPAPGSPVPTGAQSAEGAGPQGPTPTLPTTVELAAQPRPLPMTEKPGEQGAPQTREWRAETRPENSAMDAQEAERSPLAGELPANECQAEPDYVFHVIFLGDSNVGKTSFLHLLYQNSFATGLSATVGVDFRVKTLLVDNKLFALQLWDTAGQERYHSMTRQLLRKADGVVLMYDVTNQASFAHVRYWLDCLQDAGSDKAVILLLGNKMDCEEQRQVPTETGQQLAKQFIFRIESEITVPKGKQHGDRSLKMQEDHLKGSLVDVAPEGPPKKTGCCS